MVPPKSSPNELAFTITRYRKSKLSSLAEKFTRRSPSSGARFAPPPLSSREAVYRSNFNLPYTRGTRWCVCPYAQKTHTRTDHACACESRGRTCTRITRVCVKSADRECDGKVSENYTLLLFSTLYKSLPSKHLRASFHPCFQRAMVRSPNRRSPRSGFSAKGSTKSILDE